VEFLIRAEENIMSNEATNKVSVDGEIILVVISSRNTELGGQVAVEKAIKLYKEKVMKS